MSNSFNNFTKKVVSLGDKINGYTAKIQCLSGAWLKIVAMVSMLIDHINKALIYPILTSAHGFLPTLSNIFDKIGRIAFPIFCFLLVEGFFKTHNRKKYLLNLLIFGVISEVPFDMCTTASFFDKNWNNIMFSLALVLVTIWVIDILKEKMKNLPTIVWLLVCVVIVAPICLLSSILGLDYESYAILIGCFFYLFYNYRFLGAALGFATMISQPWSILGFGLTMTYNGKRGRQIKMLSYWFYPVHLLIIGMIRMILKI